MLVGLSAPPLVVAGAGWIDRFHRGHHTVVAAGPTALLVAGIGVLGRLLMAATVAALTGGAMLRLHGQQSQRD